MNILSPAHEEFLKELVSGGVEFILIGGYAVIFHGYGRTTGDMDIWLKPNEENKTRFLELLKSSKIHPDDIAHLQSLDFSKTHAFHIGEAPHRIDFLTHIAGVTYEEADSSKQFFNLGTLTIPVLHLNHLIANKLVSSRPKDKADVDELQKIMKRKKP